MRKWELERALAQAQEDARLARDEAEKQRDALARAQWELSLAQEAASQLEGVKEELVETKIKNAVLLERLDLVANYLPGAPAGPGSQTPGHMTEEEEDLRHAHATGLIDPHQLKDALEAAGLDNTEIALDFSAAEYPRLGS